MMELAQIPYVQNRANLGSVWQASAFALPLCPSNITRESRRLIRRKVSLFFTEEGRGLRITPSGEVFLASPRPDFSVNRRSKTGPLIRLLKPSGTLRIGAIDPRYEFACQQIPHIHALYPNVKLQF